MQQSRNFPDLLALPATLKSGRKRTGTFSENMTDPAFGATAGTLSPTQITTMVDSITSMIGGLDNLNFQKVYNKLGPALQKLKASKDMRSTQPAAPEANSNSQLPSVVKPSGGVVSH